MMRSAAFATTAFATTALATTALVATAACNFTPSKNGNGSGSATAPTPAIEHVPQGPAPTLAAAPDREGSDQKAAVAAAAAAPKPPPQQYVAAIPPLHPMPTASPECTAVAEHLVDLALAQISDPTEQANQRTNRARTVKQSAARCQLAGWSPAVIQCFTAANTKDAIADCDRLVDAASAAKTH